MAARRSPTPLRLGPTRFEHQPNYAWRIYRDGDPRKPIPDSRLNWRSTVAIQTSKSLDDLAGTFTITLKDKRTRSVVREMDAIRIRLAGHYRPGLQTVMKGVVDEVRPGGSADAYAGTEDTVITGRCVGKYLQVTSLFLPVWDPEAGLPTALTFGLGDAAKKVGGNRPYDIFRYLVRRFTYGDRELAGVSGIPNSRYWLDHYTRFSRHLGFQIPFLQFDEDSVAIALKRMEILGFTETWIDELGRVVYRQPQWDAPIRYSISTSELKRWAFPRSDVATATYVEVIPAGDPGIDSGTAQALRAGRAPVPSSYLNGDTSLNGTVSPEFVIDTTSGGRVTEKGARNPWYKRQRRLGLRPQQVTSPLLVTQEQAQRQAEGLLRFFARATKGGQITIPGAPEVRLGYTARLHGELEGNRFDRSFYIEQVAHDYVDGSHYDTSVVLSHGRDPWDPAFKRMVLPRFDPADLVASPDGGVLDGSAGAGGGTAAKVGFPLARRGNLIGTPGVGTHSFSAPPDNWQSDNALDIGVPNGTNVFAVDDGTISSSLGFGDSGSGGRFAGKRLHLQTTDNVWYYAHLSSFADGIAPGAEVKKGQLLGRSGSANGVPHLHIASKNGNPKRLLWD